MASKSTPESRLKRLAKEIPTEEETYNLLKSLEGQDSHASDRATAIVGAAMIENALEVVILSRLYPLLSKDDRLDLFDGDKNAPLATFSSRIRMGYALGIYGKVTQSHLDRIRTIRNVFAHSGRTLTFETTEVKDVVDKLTAYSGKNLSGSGMIKTSKERYAANVAFLQSVLRAEMLPVNYLAAYSLAYGRSRIP